MAIGYSVASTDSASGQQLEPEPEPGRPESAVDELAAVAVAVAIVVELLAALLVVGPVAFGSVDFGFGHGSDFVGFDFDFDFDFVDFAVVVTSPFVALDNSKEGF